MGQQTLEMWAGGAVLLTPAANTTLVWWWDRRVQTIRASAPSLIMTLQSPNAYTMPFGDDLLVVVNPKDATNAFSLRTLQGSTWTITVGIGQAAHVARVRSSGSGAQWWPMLANIL